MAIGFQTFCGEEPAKDIRVNLTTPLIYFCLLLWVPLPPDPHPPSTDGT